MARMPLLLLVLCIVGCSSSPRAATEIIITRQPGSEDVKAEIHFKIEG